LTSTQSIRVIELKIDAAPTENLATSRPIRPDTCLRLDSNPLRVLVEASRDQDLVSQATLGSSAALVGCGAVTEGWTAQVFASRRQRGQVLVHLGAFTVLFGGP
jgi:hypothetical protein